MAKNAVKQRDYNSSADIEYIAFEQEFTEVYKALNANSVQRETIVAPVDDITVEAEVITLDASSDINLESDADITLDAAGDIYLDAHTAKTVQVQEAGVDKGFVVDHNTDDVQVTDGYELIVKDSTNADTLTILHDGTDAKITSNTGHVTITPGTSKLMKFPVQRQDITSDSFVNNQIMLTGWGYIQGDTSTDRVTGTVTFGTTFSATPVIVAVSAGRRTSAQGAPTAIGDFGGNYRNEPATFDSFNYSTTGFSFIVYTTDISNFSATDYFGFTWTAIGQLT